MAAVVARSLPQLPLFKPDALSGLVLALGASGHSPVPPLWLDRCCLEVYMRCVGGGRRRDWGESMEQVEDTRAKQCGSAVTTLLPLIAA
jgi:hypothetical protein